MRTSVKVLLYILSVVLLTCALTAAVLFVRDWKDNRSYFAMGGDVVVLYKFQLGPAERHSYVTGDEERYQHYIVVQTAGGQSKVNYLLSCTEEQYDSVEIGDTANCDRYQKTDNWTGILHGIRTW